VAFARSTVVWCPARVKGTTASDSKSAYQLRRSFHVVSTDSKAQKCQKAYINCGPGVMPITLISELMSRRNSNIFAFFNFFSRYRRNLGRWRLINIRHSCKFRWIVGGSGGEPRAQLVHWWAGNMAQPPDAPKHSQRVQPEAVRILALRQLQRSHVFSVQRR
jgi:hypothetical protein